MPQIKNIELAQREMFTPAEELLTRYDAARVDHLLRLRDMYNWMLANPSERDRKFIDLFMGKYGIGQSQAYWHSSSSSFPPSLRRPAISTASR